MKKDAESEVEPGGIAGLAGKYLTFRLDEEFYGLRIGNVVEIVRPLIDDEGDRNATSL